MPICRWFPITYVHPHSTPINAPLNFSAQPWFQVNIVPQTNPFIAPFCPHFSYDHSHQFSYDHSVYPTRPIPMYSPIKNSPNMHPSCTHHTPNDSYPRMWTNRALEAMAHWFCRWFATLQTPGFFPLRKLWCFDVRRGYGYLGMAGNGPFWKKKQSSGVPRDRTYFSIGRANISPTKNKRLRQWKIHLRSSVSFFQPETSIDSMDFRMIPENNSEIYPDSLKSY